MLEVYDRLPDSSRQSFQSDQLLPKQAWLSLQWLEDVTAKLAIASALIAQMAYEIGKHSAVSKNSPNCMSWSNLLEIYPGKLQQIYRKMARDVAIHLCAIPKAVSVQFKDLFFYIPFSTFV